MTPARLEASKDRVATKVRADKEAKAANREPEWHQFILRAPLQPIRIS